MLAGPIMWAMEDSPEILRFYREWIKEVPDELTTIVTHRRVLPVPTIPEEFHGKHVVVVGTCYAGPVEDGESVLKPLREFGSPLLDGCVPMPFTKHQAILDPSFPHGWWYYIRSCNLAELTDEVIDTLVDHGLQDRVAGDGLFDLPSRWLRGSGGRGRNRIRRPRRGPHRERDRDNGDGRWIRAGAGVGARTVDWAASPPSECHVNFLMEEGEDRIRGPTVGPSTTG